MEKNKNLKMKVAFSFLLGAFAVWYFFILSRTEKPVQKASAQLSDTLQLTFRQQATFDGPAFVKYESKKWVVWVSDPDTICRHPLVIADWRMTVAPQTDPYPTSRQAARYQKGDSIPIEFRRLKPTE